MARKSEKVFLEAFFDGIPSLPKGIVEFLVMITPYIVLIALVLIAISLVRLVIAFLQGGFGAFIAFTGVAGILLMIQLIFYLYICYLGYKALPDLFARKVRGWMIMYKVQIYSTIFNLCMFVLTTVFLSSFFAKVPGVLISTIIVGLLMHLIGIFIGFYILFKMKPFYK